MANVTTYYTVNKWRYGFDTYYSHKGNFFEQPTMPELVPDQQITQSLRPYGFLGIPHKGENGLMLSNVGIGYFDQRLMAVEEPEEGEAFVYSDTYTAAVKLDSVQYLRKKLEEEEEQFATHATSAENTQAIVKTIFEYLVDIAAKLESFQTWASTHTHQYIPPAIPAPTMIDTLVPTQTIPNPIGSSYTNNDYYTKITQASAYNDDDQMYVKDGTELIEDL